VLAAALLFPPGQASAELLKNLKVSGQLDIWTDSADNVTDFVTRGAGNHDHLGTAETRTLLNTQWDVLDDVHANMTLRKNDRAWGTVGGGGQGSDAGQSQNLVGAAGGSSVAGNVFVQQANIKIDKLAGHFDTTLGRQYYGDAGDLVLYFGPKDLYGLFVTAIDAARFDASNDWVNFSSLVGKIAGTAIGGAGATSTDLRGMDLGWKNLPVKLNTYVWNRVVHNTTAAGLGTPGNFNDNLWVYGLKGHAEGMGGWVNADIAHNSGENRVGVAPGGAANYSGTALLADVGWKGDVANVGGFTPWGNFGWGTGRGNAISNVNDGFTAIASDYRPGIINGRFNTAGALDLTTKNGTSVSTVGLNNRVVWGAGLKFKPSALEKLTVGAGIWDYRFQTNTHNLAAFGSAAGGAGNKHIGSEFGVTADWKHSDNVSVGMGWADFQPGGFIGNTNKNASATGFSPVTLAFADFTVKF